MLRALLFDFNGVLIDDEPLHLRLLSRILVEEGLPLPADPLRRFTGLDDRTCFRWALEAAGRPSDPFLLTRWVARKGAYYQDAIGSTGYPLFAATLRLVDEAGDQGLTLGVVTGALRAEVEGALTEAGRRDRFKVVVSAEDCERGKPDPKPYLTGLERLNAVEPLPTRLFHPHEVVAVEDTPAGVASAHAAGLGVVAVSHTLPSAELSAADHVVEDVDELSVATLRGWYR